LPKFSRGARPSPNFFVSPHVRIQNAIVLRPHRSTSYTKCYTRQYTFLSPVQRFSGAYSALSRSHIRSEVRFWPQHGILKVQYCAITLRLLHPVSLRVHGNLINLTIIRTMTQSSTPPVTAPPRSPPETANGRPPITSERSLRQLSIFFLGGACLLASTAITRKAVWRRQLRVKPKFYEPNTNPHEFFSPFHDAIQALNLATMHCTSVGIMALGGIMWTFDIANLKEAQTSLRGRLNYSSIYKSEDDIPRSFSELIAASGEMRIDYEERDDNKDGSNDKSQ
jgi:hypothetical protein